MIPRLADIVYIPLRLILIHESVAFIKPVGLTTSERGDGNWKTELIEMFRKSSFILQT
tara:strand:- start:221 stop:394 length:174 start_codon:yes stop_codon:yes gene_type:complete